jgi:SNF2 family DNA or RNA helicase
MPIKCIVFSQWTQFLDLIEGPLKTNVTNGFSFARLDGSMNRPTRTAELKRFKDRRDVNVILISIKAGGVVKFQVQISSLQNKCSHLPLSSNPES